MTDRTASKTIRQIQYGLIPNLPQCVVRVGNSAKGKDEKGGFVDYIITDIVENKDTFFEYGHFEYEVYVSKVSNPEDKIFWRRYSLKPDAIEYFLSGDDEIYLM